MSVWLVASLIGASVLLAACSSAPPSPEVACAKEIAAVPTPPETPVEPKLSSGVLACSAAFNSGCDPVARDDYDKAEAAYEAANRSFLSFDWGKYNDAKMAAINSESEVGIVNNSRGLEHAIGQRD
jgi:hypothetical protein